MATGIVLALIGAFILLRTVTGKRKLPQIILGLGD